MIWQISEEQATFHGTSIGQAVDLLKSPEYQLFVDIEFTDLKKLTTYVTDLISKAGSSASGDFLALMDEDDSAEDNDSEDTVHLITKFIIFTKVKLISDM